MVKKVELLLGGSPYTVWCGENDEEKIIHLGRDLETRIGKIYKSLRPDSEAHAFFLMSLMLLSEIQEKERHEKEADTKIRQELAEQKSQQRDYEKEIRTLEAALSQAKKQVSLMADKVEKILGGLEDKAKK